MDSTYTLEVSSPITIKQSTAQSSSLAEADLFKLQPGKYPVDAVAEKDGHWIATFGLDGDGKRVTFNGKNTWAMFQEHVRLVQNGMAKESSRQIWTPNSVVNWRDPNCRVSKFFRVVDVTQGDYRRIPTSDQIIRNVLTLAKELDKIREAWGNPIGVTSWYRPPAINRAVGGVSNSQHINGGAADVYSMIGRDDEFERFLDKRWDKALGYGVASGRGFSHLDLRAGRIRWYY